LEAFTLEALALAGSFRTTRAFLVLLAGFFGARTEAAFARWVRMIFAMKRIY
jgi:hypothetical protein